MTTSDTSAGATLGALQRLDDGDLAQIMGGHRAKAPLKAPIGGARGAGDDDIGSLLMERASRGLHTR